MLEGKIMIGETDMSMSMQRHAMQCATHALDTHAIGDCQSIAQSLKQEFDKCFGSGWQCVVGTNFASYISHSHGHFIYFHIGKLAFLLFKGMPTSYH